MLFSGIELPCQIAYDSPSFTAQTIDATLWYIVSVCGLEDQATERAILLSVDIV
jgi:hypothetical protein